MKFIKVKELREILAAYPDNFVCAYEGAPYVDASSRLRVGLPEHQPDIVRPPANPKHQAKSKDMDFIPDAESPACPRCESPMVRKEAFAGPFWGCMNYPDCKGTRDIDDATERWDRRYEGVTE